MNPVEFDKDRHEYKFDGKIIPSVTQLIPFEKSDFVTDEQMEFARQEGIYIHGVIDTFLKTNAVDDESIIRPFSDFLEEAGKSFGQLVLSETPLASSHPKFAGTPDLVFDNAIVDIKRTFHNKKIHALQCAAYNFLAAQNKVIKRTKNHLILVIDMDTETYTTHSVYDNQSESVFLNLVHKWHIEEQFSKYLKSV
ncbi:MAG: hypothetical protein L6Q54_11785 [Leptospiraceae bacterium]|nr:hypothetical protein [Leptospiraceae bacterium]